MGGLGENNINSFFSFRTEKAFNFTRFSAFCKKSQFQRYRRHIWNGVQCNCFCWLRQWICKYTEQNFVNTNLFHIPSNLVLHGI